MLIRKRHVLKNATAAVALFSAGAIATPAGAAPDTAGQLDPVATEPPPAAAADASAAGEVGIPESDLARPGESVLVDADHTTIAPGMELTTFERLEDGGWNAGSVLQVDLTADVTLDYQYSGTVTETKTVRSMAERSGATAAINGDFYDIDASGAPLGVGVARDEGLITTPQKGHENAFAVGDDGAVRLAQVFLEGELVLGDGSTLELSGVNAFQLPADGIGVFTSAWGEYTRADSVDGDSVTAEVRVVDGKVADVSTDIGAGPIDGDDIVVVGRGAGAEALLDLNEGDPVDVTYAPRSDAGDVAVALGGNQVLMEDGEQRDFSDDAAHPRSALGLSEDGTRMYLVSVDGRQAHAHGMTLTETAGFMGDIGAHDALNIDGGGSSTLVTREPGTDDLDVINSPSDGSERPVANGMGLFAAEGSGELDGFRVLAGDAENSDRVFPGLTRDVDALGHDETNAPVEARPRWRTSDRTVASVARDSDGATVTGVAPGDTDVNAAVRGAEGELGITVLDELRRLEADSRRVPLAGPDDTGNLTLTGYDIDGYRAPVEPSDVEVTGEDGVVELVAGDDGFTVRPLTDSGSTRVTLEVAGVQTSVAITVGLDEEMVADFSDADAWTASFARASGAIESTEGPDGRSGVRMTYDFSGANTRAAYAEPPEPVELPGQPQALKAWVRGDGNGTWIRMRVEDASGTPVTLDGGYTDFTGWEQLTFPVPAGTEYPLTLRDIYAVEASGDSRYEGETSFSDITADVAPDVELPEEERFEDPAILTNGTASDAPQRIAVMSDAQFVAADPDSDLVEAARRTLQEIVAAEPDMLVINGDFVDEAAPEDFQLARTILDEELADADFPWYYAPGNHEIQGGPISNFIDEFGATQHTVDVDGTRVVTLNSAHGTLRADGEEFDQIAELRRALDDAATDPTVTGVVVFAHHPPNDPLPSAHSQLGDRLEARMVESWLGEFEAGSGKSAAYVGAHVGVFDATSVDGVPFLVNGNSGKNPSSTPGNGGFTGWTMLGIDPSKGATDNGWFAAETKTRVDGIELDAPGSVGVDERSDVSATVDQDGDRQVPVQWPVSAQWGGESVHVGAASDAPEDAVVAVDAAAGDVIGLREGTATLEVTVNGETASREITVGM